MRVSRETLQDCFLNVVVFFQKILSYIAWLLGPVCVVVAVGLISLVIYVYFTAILPQYMLQGYFSFTAISHLLIALWLSFNLAFNYFMCITTNPGRPGPSFACETDQIEEEDDYCYICKIMKPQRTHHCSVCNKCTLRMDHHCPWMANCVGHFNYKYFVLFLFYMAISCIYIFTITTLPVHYGGVSRRLTAPGLDSGIIGFISVLCLSIAIAVGGMFLWHFYLVISQQTTIEFYVNQLIKRQAAAQNYIWSNKFNVGLHKNVDGVFGHNSLWWRWVLPSTKPPPGDGVAFWTRTDVPEFRKRKRTLRTTSKSDKELIQNV